MTLPRDAKLLVSRYFSPVGGLGNRQRGLHKCSLHGTPAAPAMSFASCARYEHGFFTAYAGLP